MTPVETVWMVTANVAIACGILVFFVGWFDDSVEWGRAVGIVLLQWFALILQASIAMAALSGGG